MEAVLSQISSCRIGYLISVSDRSMSKLRVPEGSFNFFYNRLYYFLLNFQNEFNFENTMNYMLNFKIRTRMEGMLFCFIMLCSQLVSGQPKITDRLEHG